MEPLKRLSGKRKSIVLEEVPLDGEKFKLNVQDLRELFQTRENPSKIPEAFEKIGGLEGLAKILDTDLESGLKEEEEQLGFERRIQEYGTNHIPEPPTKSFFWFLWNAWKDPILILLSVFAVISIIFNGIVFPPEGQENTGWLEGLAIGSAVILVVGVGAGNNFAKDRKFNALNRIKNDRLVKIMRGGKPHTVSINTLLVGDVVTLNPGDRVPADGVLIKGFGVRVDESSMTGESKTAKKEPNTPFLISGTQISEGNLTMLIIAVGMNSEWGIVYSKLKTELAETPLQENLSQLAKLVGYIGTVVAVLLFTVLIIRYIVDSVRDEDWEAKSLTKLINFAIQAITLIVVAVPEGLPLAVTIALAYSMKSMLKDNNLVRHLSACETMGGATNICSDKTGTLTENKMTVTEIWASEYIITGTLETTVPEKLNDHLIEIINVGISVNSTAHIKPNKQNKMEFIGNITECALLVLVKKLGDDYMEIRRKKKVITSFPFSSSRKRMSTMIENEKGGCSLHVKGASEIITSLSVNYLDSDGNLLPFTEKKKEEIYKIIENFAKEGLRTIGLAYRDFNSEDGNKDYEEPPESDLTLVAIVGIMDPLRPEVKDSIELCKKAGITVRMVTGDNVLTATKIARDCGILEDGFEVMEGPDFRKLTDEELDAILPKLRVLARSSPTDKHRLVVRLRHHNEVVAVTGDGTNDGPALKAADIGMAMGITGTEIAKEASDIIIMDDNFTSIVKAVMWGRNVRESIQKFIQFQITINFAALTTAFVAAAAGLGQPLTPIQLLWVNLIQDSLAALALATAKPTEKLLLQKPAGRHERLITPIMWRNIAIMSTYQVIFMFAIMFSGDKIFGLKEDVDLDEEPSTRYTILFNIFVFLQLFNEVNCRILNNEWNVFDHFFENFHFIFILLTTIVLQVIFVEVGGRALSTKPLSGAQWLNCLAFGSSSLLVGLFIRLFIPAPDNWMWLKYKKGYQPDEEGKELLQVEIQEK